MINNVLIAEDKICFAHHQCMVTEHILDRSKTGTPHGQKATTPLILKEGESNVHQLGNAVMTDPSPNPIAEQACWVLETPWMPATELS